MRNELSPLERDVVLTILALDHPVMNALRRQVDRCSVASRHVTGVGFFTTFDVPSDVEPAPVRSGIMGLGDVTAEIEGLDHGAGFVLFVRDGILRELEGFSYDDPWPDVGARHQVTGGGVVHSGGSRTDLEAVNEAWVRD